MKKISILLMLVGYFVLSATVLSPKKIHKVVLGKAGYQPAQLIIRKGDIVEFTSSLNSAFWPASDPHPTHSLYPEFDATKGIQNTESWTFKFAKSGIWNYHDHINANLRGEIKVEDENLLTATWDSLAHWYKIKFQKHNDRFLNQTAAKCNYPDWDDHSKFDVCWINFFSEITNDFGATEAMRLIAQASKTGLISDSDCHNFSDQVGIDGYWQYVAGRKFALTPAFSICYDGFFHGFMLEHVSHGQNFSDSIALCETLDKSDPYMVRECYVGIGNGLTYYYWSLYISDLDKIVEHAISECNKLGSQKDSCVYGVFGGVEHLFLGVHGSELQVNSKDPFSLCFRQKNIIYRDYCVEKVSRPLFSALDYDVAKITALLNQIPSVQVRQSVALDFGDMISHFGSYNSVEDITKVVIKCKAFPSYLSTNCLVGLFNRLFANTEELGGKFKSFDCNLDSLNVIEKRVCMAEKETFN